MRRKRRREKTISKYEYEEEWVWNRMREYYLGEDDWFTILFQLRAWTFDPHIKLR